MSEWMAYTRGGKKTQRLVSRRKPYGYGWESSEPTAAEIAEAVAKENAEREVAETYTRFRARAECTLADEIRAAIEYMEPTRHPLDNLTLEQWRAFHAAICGTAKETNGT